MVDSHRSNQNTHGSGRAARRGETRGRLPWTDALKASATHRGRIPFGMLKVYYFILCQCVLCVMSCAILKP